MKVLLQFTLAKSEGFIVGPCENVGPPQLPGGLQWRKEGIQMLGVFR